jgi:hypothetical protein
MKWKCVFITTVGKKYFHNNAATLTRVSGIVGFMLWNSMIWKHFQEHIPSLMQGLAAFAFAHFGFFI